MPSSARYDDAGLDLRVFSSLVSALPKRMHEGAPGRAGRCHCLPASRDSALADEPLIRREELTAYIVRLGPPQGRVVASTTAASWPGGYSPDEDGLARGFLLGPERAVCVSMRRRVGARPARGLRLAGRIADARKSRDRNRGCKPARSTRRLSELCSATLWPECLCRSGRSRAAGAASPALAPVRCALATNVRSSAARGACATPDRAAQPCALEQLAERACLRSGPVDRAFALRYR